MKKPTQDLIDEHGGIILMLTIMKKVGDKLQGGEQIKKDHMDKIVEFLRNFADKCHHGKEEGILFPKLVNNNSEIINELLAEHQTGRQYIKNIAENNSVAQNINSYIALLTEHIRKENEILFPIADKQLSEEEQVSIAEDFERLERDVIGPGKHEEYHSWLDELKSYYLN